MKAWIWGVTALLAAIWTGLAWGTAEALAWAAQAVNTGEAADWGRTAAQWPVPDWLAIWVDPALLRWGQEAITWLVDVMPSSGAMAQQAVGWIVGLVWLGWGLGLVVLLAVAGVVHWLVGRARRPGPPAVSAMRSTP